MAALPRWKLLTALDRLPRLGLDLPRDQALGGDAARVPLGRDALPPRRRAAGADPRAARPQHPRHAPRARLLRLLGLSLLALGVGMVTLAETRIDSSIAAMIAGSVLLQVILLRTLARDRVARDEAERARRPGGAGTDRDPRREGASSAVGLAMALAASISWSLGSYFRQPAARCRGTASSRRPGRCSAPASSCSCSASPAASCGRWSRPDSASSRCSRGSISDLRHPGRVHRLHLAAAERADLEGRHPPVRELLIVAIALGALLLGEEITLAVGVGAALIVGSVFVAVRSENAAAGKRRSSSSPRSELLLRIGPSEARVASRRSTR